VRRFLPLVAALSFAVPGALAADTDRAVLVPGLSAAVTTIPQYTRTRFDRDSGSWRGPNCAPRGRLDLAAPLVLSWSVGVYRAASAEEAGVEARAFEWKVVAAASLRLPHVIRGRTVGTIPAALVVTDSASTPGYHESSVAFRLIGSQFVAAEAWSHGNTFACVVDGAGPAEEWHRRAAREALADLRVEGNFPPSRVTARRSGRRLSGAVTDVNRHPLVGAPVTLERRRGKLWRAVSRTRTTAAGRYVVRLRPGSLYRVTATAGRVTTRSRAVHG
jgi:hypothetical protein